MTEIGTDTVKEDTERESSPEVETGGDDVSVVTRGANGGGGRRMTVTCARIVGIRRRGGEVGASERHCLADVF